MAVSLGGAAGPRIILLSHYLIIKVWRNSSDDGWQFLEEGQGIPGLQEKWTQIETWCSSLGKGLDLLRVDFFLRKVAPAATVGHETNGAKLNLDKSAKLEVVANEMCAFLWPESRFFRPLYPQLIRKFKRGFVQRI